MATKTQLSLIDIKKRAGYYFSRLLSYPLVIPEQAYFSLTGRCNLKCKMCNVVRDSDSSELELSTDECKKMINEIARLGIDHLVLSGGEPLMRQDLFELIGYASKRIRLVDMITNGQLIDNGTAARLISSGLRHITFSLDGLEKSHDAVRGKGVFKKTIESIDLVNKHKNSFGYPTTAINFTIMGQNAEDILPVLELAKVKKVSYVLFQPVLYNNKKMWERLVNNSLWVKECEVPRLREVIQELLRRKMFPETVFINVETNVLKMIPDYFLGQGLSCRVKCYEGIVRIVIGHGGDLWSCQGVYGNLKERSLVDCWFSKKAREIRMKTKRCQRHCLQPCICFPGPAAIYRT